jgi:hypothetical protein
MALAGRFALTLRDAQSSDFRCFWEAGRLVRSGLDPFDRADWAAATGAFPAVDWLCDPTFVYPMWTAIAFAPFSLMPEPAALVLWIALCVTATVAAVIMLGRLWQLGQDSALLLIALLVCAPMYSEIANAQVGPILLLAVAGLSLASARSQHRLSAAWWCALLLKPHVVLVVIAGAFARLRARAFVVTSLTAATAVVAVSLLVDPQWPLALLREIAAQRRVNDLGLVTFWGLAAATGAPPIAPVVAALTATGLVAATAVRRQFTPPELIAVLVPASFLVTPYARLHDEVILAVTWAALLGRARTSAHGQWIRVGVVVLALVAPWAVVFGGLGLGPSAHILITLATALTAASALGARREVDLTLRATPTSGRGG